VVAEQLIEAEGTVEVQTAEAGIEGEAVSALLYEEGEIEGEILADDIDETDLGINGPHWQ